VKQHAQIKVPGIKVAVPLPAEMLPKDLVPMEGPAGEPTLELILEGSNLVVLAKLNGKNYRKIADFRGGVTCLLRTQLSSVDRVFFPGFDGP
jgi:hypothetical protein